MIDRLLSFDHRIRPSAEEALCKYAHLSRRICLISVILADPYFESLHDPMEEPSAPPLADEHQDGTYSTSKWKGKSHVHLIRSSFNSKADIFSLE